MKTQQKKIVPSKKQLEFLSWEFGLFFHFGIRSFYPFSRDWDMKTMELSAFDPPLIDCDEWLKTAKDAGAKYAIFTAKHHDGFANWPSAYTDYSVENVPWLDGKGDVVKLFTDACRKYDIKVGIYYSPADYRIKNGTLSGREFEDNFIAQISELLTNYGTIDYLWFDGCGSEGLTFDRARIINTIRSLQPDILIFNMWDPDVRWIGNELGYAPKFNSNIVNSVNFSVMTSEKELLDSKMFLPAECDMRMRDTYWFTSDDSELDTVKSVDKLMDVYENSVGHGANMLLNIGPAATGRLPEADKTRLLEFAQAVKERFSEPVGMSESRLTVEFETTKISTVVIEEDLTEGETIYGFDIYADDNLVYSGKTVGHKAICCFDATPCKKIKVALTEVVGEAKICRVSAFR